ncbi:hypothetical protein DFH08DRAFT_809685 [Mycena albidolilacea]|uniref:Uncharacterized protein n=1 Tax=Mycena albidolilacea TaxID=1033008 RepID=A0AAD7A160_9AGAR|nr:hypothetical protein DFH08DRAFT_809685 [Mycena albidolilacea]
MLHLLAINIPHIPLLDCLREPTVPLEQHLTNPPLATRIGNLPLCDRVDPAPPSDRLALGEGPAEEEEVESGTQRVDGRASLREPGGRKCSWVEEHTAIGKQLKGASRRRGGG